MCRAAKWGSARGSPRSPVLCDCPSKLAVGWGIELVFALLVGLNRARQFELHSVPNLWEVFLKKESKIRFLFVENILVAKWYLMKGVITGMGDADWEVFLKEGVRVGVKQAVTVMLVQFG